MHRRVIVIMLLSACRLLEEPTQQAKDAFVSGDVVFAAQDLSQTAVLRCRDKNCRRTENMQYILHQVELSGGTIKDVLQFDNLHISFQSGDKTYTCLRLSAPLGKMTLLWRDSNNKHCYEQVKDTDYVQQLAAACVTAEGWQLVADIDASDMKKFACAKDNEKISSACFIADNGTNCTASSWPESIQSIHASVVPASTIMADEPEKQEITANTQLKDVKIMAEWKLMATTGTVTCSGIEEKARDFSGTSNKLDVSTDFHEDGDMDDFLVAFQCSAGGEPIPGLSRGDDIDRTHNNYRGPPWICVTTDANSVAESFDKCNKQSEYIKITFEAK